MICARCGSPAVVEYELSHGCFCDPTPGRQALCPQHDIKIAIPAGGTAKLIWHDPKWEPRHG